MKVEVTQSEIEKAIKQLLKEKFGFETDEAVIKFTTTRKPGTQIIASVEIQ